ncbi:hypothetical protein HS041_11715 [Planomonospora sp. ID67723]|uniref:hypothetical protein n=1 Tax=Planomonospora sp. ID67723 TaxID=2738134 RepID=UPI0018C3B952|nr:hypothetical protein [Planomonospora sp. ID67723]MBG0828433.1 hypothetical protein [Planomonospora sp. ID67723]
MFGYPPGGRCAEEEAPEEIHRSGLEMPMRPWWFRQDGERYRCVIPEAAPGEARVRPDDRRYPYDVYALTPERPGPEVFRPGQ